MAILKTKVDYRRAMKKLEKAKKEIFKAGQATVSELAYMGSYHAKAIAPFYSGKTVSLIKVFKGTNKDGPYANIVAQNPTASDGHKRNIANFNLVRWMHATGGIGRPSFMGRDGKFYTKSFGPTTKKIKSGDPRFMYKTRDYLKRMKIQVARGKFNLTKIR